MSLTRRQIDIVHLIRRSKPEVDGWYRVSKILWPLVCNSLPDDLVEVNPTDDGGFIRFTNRGQAVADYL